MELIDHIIEGDKGGVVVSIADDRLGHPKTLVLKSHVIHLFNAGHRQIVLNCEHLESMDSFGLAVLVSLLKMSREQGGSLALCHLSEDILRLIELTRLDRILTIFSTEQEAVAHLS